MLKLAIAGRSISLRLHGKLEAYPDPAPRSLAAREERFFAVSPKDPFSYEEGYEDLFDDPWENKRSEREKSRIIERGNLYPSQINRARELLDERRKRQKKNDYDVYTPGKTTEVYWNEKDFFLEQKSRSSYDYYSNYGKDYSSEYHRICKRYPDGPLSIHEAAQLAYTPVVDIKDIVDAIHNSVAPKENIRGIVLMGSASKVRQEITVKRGFLGFKYTTISNVLYTSKIHDVDILVLLKPKTKKKVGEVEANGEVHTRVSDGYGCYSDTRSVIGMYDIFGLTTEEYEDGLHRGDFMTEHVREYGVLLAGEFPYPKSDTEIVWSRGGKGKWKPKRILKKTSLMHRRKV